MKTKFSRVAALLLALLVQIAFAQQRTITGTVSDESGPLPGVNVIIKGTATGTQTDFDGQFTIQAATGDILVFSYVGMTTSEFTVGSSDVIDVVMSGSNMLEEVVVTAYGTQKKESLTGSITEVSAEEFAKVPSGNAVTGLTGKVAGVQIYSNSGQPGAAPSVRFRGIGSLNGSSAPLYVVDGVPFNESITTLNPNDIEKMSFIKDASAAALYGNRGANGVVIITTKKGRKGKINVNVDFKYSFTDRAVKDYEVITNMGDYFEAYHKVLKNNDIVENGTSVEQAGLNATARLLDDSNVGLVYNPYGGDRTNLVDPVTGQFRGGTPLWQEDWRDFLFDDNSGVTNAYMSISGGSDNTDYFFSAGFEDNKGYNINTGFKRITTKANIKTDINDNLSTGLSLNYTNREQRGTLTNNITGNFAWVRNVAPIYPVYAKDHLTGETFRDSRGNPFYDWAGVISPNAPGGRPYSGFSNPVALQTLNVNEDVRDNLYARFFATWNFLDDFSFTYNLGYDLANFNSVDYTNKIVGSAVDVGGRLTEQYGRGTTLTNQELLTWKRSFNDVHNLDVILGHENSNYDFKSLDASLRNQFLSDDLSPYLFAQPDGTDAIGGGYTEYNLEGYFARVMYDYDKKYFVNGSFRRDGSSVFSEDNRWGNFWGAGFAWMMSAENWMEDVDWLNTFKLKTSVGQQGNDIVFYPGTTTRNYAPYLDQWTVTSNGTDFELNKSVIGNKDLTWETSNNFNAGFESSMFDSRLSLEFEYFVRKIDDLIFNRPLPSSTGLPSVPENVMDMKNQGFEILLSYLIINNENVNWDVDLNMTSYKNEITKLVPGKEFIDNGAYRWIDGGSAFEFFMRDFVGVNPENGNAMWRTDSETDPVTGEPTNGVTENYSIATEYLLGKSALPDVYGGISTSVTWKGFDFAISCSFQWGGYSYDNIYGDTFDGEVGKNFHKDYIKTWTWDNTDATLPRISPDNNNWNQFSDFYLQKSDYFSINDISLGYTFSSSVTDALSLDKLRVYFNANNVGLITASDIRGFDPRQSVTGNNDAVRYAALRSLTFGLNLNF